MVTVNSAPINETPFNMFFLNTPHPPNCTVTVLDKKIVEYKKFNALVQLRDQNGDPVNSQQNVSAYLKFPDMKSKTMSIISSSSDSPDKYTLALTPPSSGEGELSVFVDDQPVASPCVITISKSGNMLRVFKDRAFKMLLIGETGSGKTSFNLLYNCATVQDLDCGFGAEGLEQFKQFNDIKLENARSLSMESKTDDATLYNVEVGDLKVGVIDTPGFGDSRGFKKDKTNAQRIINALKREEYINCVCLIINGRQARASVLMKYDFSEITSILPKGIIDNVIVVFSNAANRMDLMFDPNLLKEYFGNEVMNICFVENPYCRFEKVKAKASQLGNDRVALQKAFEDTSEFLTEMCETIKDFPQVHTHRFIKLYEKRQDIEKSVAASLSVYDNQMVLEKSLKDVKAEVDAAVESKTLNKDFKTVQRYMKWVVKKSDDHNVLCRFKGCHNNCQLSCHLPKSFDKHVLKQCTCIGQDGLCRVCGHSYTYHYLEGAVFRQEEVVHDVITNVMKMRKFIEAENDVERAKMLYNNFERKVEESKAKRKQLFEKLSNNIIEFESLGVARNYAKLIENQLAVIRESQLEGIVGLDDLRKTKNDLEKRLEVIRAAKSGSMKLTL